MDRLGETGAGACARPLLNCPSCVPLALRRARGLMPPEPEFGCRVMPQRGTPFSSVDSAVTLKPNRS